MDPPNKKREESIMVSNIITQEPLYYCILFENLHEKFIPREIKYFNYLGIIQSYQGDYVAWKMEGAQNKTFQSSFFKIELVCLLLIIIACFNSSFSILNSILLTSKIMCLKSNIYLALFCNPIEP